MDDILNADRAPAEPEPDHELSGQESDSNQFNELPDEILLVVLSHMNPQDLLALSCTTRSMNRIAIQHLLKSRGIPKPTDRCTFVLSDHPDGIPIIPDTAKILLHSVHIKKIRALSLYFTDFDSYSSLSAALRRAMRFLHNLEGVRDLNLKLKPRFDLYMIPEEEDRFHDMFVALEDLLNGIVVKSCCKLRIFGSRVLLGDYYEFRKTSATALTPPDPAPQPSGEIAMDVGSDSDGPSTAAIDDLRYSRKFLTPITLRCSPEALEQTQLTGINLRTADILRPPFSQWIFGIMKASKIRSVSLSGSHLPSDPEELEFALQRLAAALPLITRVYLYSITQDVMAAMTKWINSFTLLQEVIIVPGFADEGFAELQQPPSPSSSSDSKVAAISALPVTPPPISTFAFASTLKIVSGPHQFLTYLFTLSQDGKSSKSDPFPQLETVILEYACIRGVSLELPVLAKALERVKAALPGSQSLSSALMVHIRFDDDFLGLAPSTPEGTVQDVPAVLGEVETLRLSLPGKWNDIALGKFDDEALDVLNGLKGVKELTLVSQRDVMNKSREELGWEHSQVFKERNKELRFVYLDVTPGQVRA